MKKIVILALVLAMALSLASCGKSLSLQGKETLPKKTVESNVLTGTDVVGTVETTEAPAVSSTSIAPATSSVAIISKVPGSIEIPGIPDETKELPAPSETVVVPATSSVATTSKTPVSIQIPGAFDEEKALSQLQVNTYKRTSKPWYYAFVEIINNSEYDLEISVDLKYYDASGALIGADHRSENAVQSGTSVLIYTMPDEDFEKIEYEVSVSEEDYYDCVVKDLSFESVSAKNKEIVTIKNNGNKVADFVECSILFFKGDEVVGFDQNYFTDDDSELKPGKSKTVEMDCYEEYDSYKYYLTGRHS